MWGARLDPLTDKILILAPLLWLGAAGSLPLWAIWLLLARELLISGWRAGQGSGGARLLERQSENDPAVRLAAAVALARWLGHRRPRWRALHLAGLLAVLALAAAGPELRLGLFAQGLNEAQPIRASSPEKSGLVGICLA